MQAWFCDNPIGVDALRWADVPTPEPADHQVRVAVHAASLNFPDLRRCLLCREASSPAWWRLWVQA
jgi:NADPH:quinone reductase-like Zn-dependent oxidoreductase